MGFEVFEFVVHWLSFSKTVEPIAKLPAMVEPKPGAGQKVPFLAPLSIPYVMFH